MSDFDSAHVGVYQILDHVLGSSAVPPGVRGAMFSIVDRLRGTFCPVEEVERVQRISVEIHKLESAIRGRDDAAVRTCREALKSMAVALLDSRVSNRPSSARALHL